MRKKTYSTPQWLRRPSPGFDIFNAGPQRKQSINSTQYSTAEYLGPHRLIAKRDSEIFVVVNNQIRWADLSLVKDDYELSRESSKRRSRRSRSYTPEGDYPSLEGADGNRKGYRVLNVGSIPQIRQLIASPEGNFLAILTSHTVHIAILPESSHLSSKDDSPIRLKCHQLGPTTHVIPESPVMSALWHPLGVDSSTLVTVTADASVRIWELKRENQWSFDQPTLAIDLKKLVDGKSSDENFEPSSFGAKKGFSPDEVDMEVASACFGGMGLDEEDGWASMTLWVAMRNRDLYALSPLLPSKWEPSATIIPSLSTAVVSKAAFLQDDSFMTEVERKVCNQQFRWFSEIDNQEPMFSPSGAEIYNRPTSIGPIPKLQGPYAFDLPIGEDDESDITDILVIASKVDADELLQNEDDEDLEAIMAGAGVSATLICLATDSGKVFICMDLDGVEGQWLPKLRHKAFAIPSSTTSDLTIVSVETLEWASRGASGWPLFTQDILDRYEFFVTSMSAVESFSLRSWAERLENEISSSDPSGLTYRVKVLCSTGSEIALKDDLIYDSFQDPLVDGIPVKEGKHLNACLVFHDLNLGGCFVLTSHMQRPSVVTYDTPTLESNALPSIEEHRVSVAPARSPSPPPLQLLPRPRSPYQPSVSFYSHTPLTNFIQAHVPPRHREAMKRGLRLSAATLDIMTAAHRILSQQTSKLEVAAAELFRRCQLLQEQMRDQVKSLREIADKVDNVVDDSPVDEEDDDEPQNKVVRRLEAAKRRQEVLVERVEAVRRKLGRNGGRELSDKEKAWTGEIGRLKVGILKDDDIEGEEEPEGEQSRRKEKNEDELLWKRYEMVQDLASDLLEQVKTASENMKSSATKGSTMSPTRGSDQLSRIPSRIQKARVSEAMGMVERESAIIDAITARLARLDTGTAVV